MGAWVRIVYVGVLVAAVGGRRGGGGHGVLCFPGSGRVER